MEFFYIVNLINGVMLMIRISALYYKKVKIGKKEYFLISACKWSRWWEFLAYDNKNKLYDIDVYFTPEQEKELDENICNPQGIYTIDKYQDVEVKKLTPDILQVWNIINMEEVREESSIFEEWENHPFEELVKSREINVSQ